MKASWKPFFLLFQHVKKHYQYLKDGMLIVFDLGHYPLVRVVIPFFFGVGSLPIAVRTKQRMRNCARKIGPVRQKINGKQRKSMANVVADLAGLPDSPHPTKEVTWNIQWWINQPSSSPQAVSTAVLLFFLWFKSHSDYFIHIFEHSRYML